VLSTVLPAAIMVASSLRHMATLQFWHGPSRVGVLAGGRSFRACRCRSSLHGVLALAGAAHRPSRSRRGCGRRRRR